MKNILHGLLIGLVVGIIDVLVFKFILGVPVSELDALGAVTFWIAAGMIIHTSVVPFYPVIKGIVIAVSIGVAWLVDAVNQGRSEQIIFLIGIFVFYGALTGFISGRLRSMPGH